MPLSSLYVLALIVIASLVVRLLDGLPRQVALLAVSLAFICLASWRHAVFLVVASGVVWFCGRRRGRLQGAGVVLLVAALCVYKYAEARNAAGSRPLFIPLGWSFFAFQAISYLADVSRGAVPPGNFLGVSLYLLFFPRLVSGPLQRNADFSEQLACLRPASRQDVADGFQIYCLGVFKKLVLADRLAVFVDEVYATPRAFSGASIALALASYSLQLYFDFSGYSDMAVGAGRMMGFRLPRNFNMPYLSRNVTEFWRRWHISLSLWIRDYLYIPLGGNRRGRARQYVNQMLAMALCGLWHGASPAFLAWGLGHGLALVAHKAYRAATAGRRHGRGGQLASSLATFCLVTLLWVPFRAGSIGAALLVYRRLFTLAGGMNQPYLWSFVSIALLLAASLYVSVRRSGEAAYPLVDVSRFRYLTPFLVFLGLIVGLCYTGGSPFIYGAF